MWVRSRTIKMAVPLHTIILKLLISICIVSEQTMACDDECRAFIINDMKTLIIDDMKTLIINDMSNMLDPLYSKINNLTTKIENLELEMKMERNPDSAGCANNNGGCSDVCENIPSCSCNTGYMLMNDSKTCQDIDECVTNDGRGDCQHQCQNSAGSYSCSCRIGYRLMADRKICQAVIDGQWGSWSSWTSCSKICGGGTRQRQKMCNKPEPANGGLNCIGDDTENENCNARSCVPSCPTGFTLVGQQQCLQYIRPYKTWVAAQADCKAKGWELANLQHADIDAVAAYVRSLSDSYPSAWVAARQYSGPQFQWTTTKDALLNNWATGQPDEPGTDNCVLLGYGDGRYWDAPCSGTASVLCSASVIRG